MGSIQEKSRGFTLIEMLVVAPIVILAIGGFIAAIVGLTGEVLSSRGLNKLTYDVQSALNQMESDIKLSNSFLAQGIPPSATNPQGSGANGLTQLENIGNDGPILILSAFATTSNPISQSASFLYYKDKPNPCSSGVAQYSKNQPLIYNIVYFIDANDALWRRVVMPTVYSQLSEFCGVSVAPWQVPSCNISSTFCKTRDSKLIEGVKREDFKIDYLTSASATSPITNATSPAFATPAAAPARAAALLGATSSDISIKAVQTIAGRDITANASLRVSRLDTNASALLKIPPATTPSAPTLSSDVTEGHKVTFKWPTVEGATSYSARYRISTGAFSAAVELPSNTREFVVTAGNHSDTVTTEITAKNSAGTSTVGSRSTVIPKWAPLILKNGWVEYGAGYNTPAYTKTSSGIVLLKGMIKNVSAVSVNSIIAQLPVDYRPAGGNLYFGTSTSSNVSARVNVYSDGSVLFSDSGTNTWFSLESIRFVPDGRYTRNTPTLLNGFTNYGSGWAPASYVRDQYGRMHIQGLLSGGTKTNGTPIFTLAASLLPSLYQHLPSRSASFHHLGVAQTGQGAGLVAKGDGSGAYSINGSYFPASGSTATWTTPSLANGWTANGGTFMTPGYTKTGDGLVTLRGAVKHTAGVYDTTVFTLPVGFRPSQRILYTSVANGAYSRLDILPTGEVRYMGTVANIWFALDAVVFSADQ